MTSPDTGASAQLAGAVDALTREFDGVFSSETVSDVLADSLGRLGPARTRAYQPVLAYRFARQRLQDSAAASGAVQRPQPVVLFVCTDNAGRSQLAAALLERAAEGRVVVRSAGSAPAEALHDEVVDALAEAGVDTAGAFPKPLAPETLQAADVVITMGCGDEVPVLAGRRHLDWALPDPASATPAEVRALRDELAGRVQLLLHELLDAPPSDGPDRLLDDGLLRLLGDPLRARIVELLSTEALCTSHLVGLTGAKQTNVSNHLKLLREAGLVAQEPCGRFTYYVLAPEPLVRLAGQLAALAPPDPDALHRRACP